jgi:hypothetical protein
MLVMESTKKLNFFPSKGGISEYYSPRMILHQKKLDYKKHCKHSFGSYVQAHDEPNLLNTIAARTLDGIYLQYTNSHQGGHEILHLPTNRTITRKNITEIPVNKEIVKQVNCFARQENMVRGLKILTHNNTALYNLTLLAGVDDDNTEHSLDQKSIQDTTQEFNQRDEEEEREQNQDTMDPDDIVEANVIPKQYILLEEENDDQSYSEQKLDGQDQDNESKETNVNKEAEEDLIQEQQFNNDQQIKTQSERVSRPVFKYVTHHNHLQTQSINPTHYTVEYARIIATTMTNINYTFAQTYSLAKGIKVFAERGLKAAYNEMKQLHNQCVFKPINVNKLSTIERRRAMESLIFLTEKRDGTIKARTCANASTQREYTEKDKAASPTALTESHLITAVAKQGRDVMTANIPNAVVQTDMTNKNNNEKTIIKIRGTLVNMLVDIDPTLYQDFVLYESKNKILYVEMKKALYGMLQSSLLYYKKFRKDLEGIGFVVNPYNPCVANRTINRSQHTVT